MPGRSLRPTVEHDRPTHEDEALDVVLDGAELVRDVDDRDAELTVERRQQLGERLLRLGVDAGGRLVEHEQRRLAGQRLRDERALLHPARERAERRVGDRREADPVDRLRDLRPIFACGGVRAGAPTRACPRTTTSRTVAGASPPTWER